MKIFGKHKKMNEKANVTDQRFLGQQLRQQCANSVQVLQCAKVCNVLTVCKPCSVQQCAVCKQRASLAIPINFVILPQTPTLRHNTLCKDLYFFQWINMHDSHYEIDSLKLNKV